MPVEDTCSLLRLANKYMMNELEVQCTCVLVSSISLDTVLRLLEVAKDVHALDLERACLDFAVLNSEHLVHHESYQACNNAGLLRVLTTAFGKALPRTKRRR